MTSTYTRRIITSCIASGLLTALSGCLTGSRAIFETVSVEDTAIVVEFDEESPADRLNVIQPDGELFDERPLPTGATRVTIEIGTSYQPGEYTIIALRDGDELDRTSLEIEPDVQIVDLRLGRNHPELMFEGATAMDIRTEVIATVENVGTGPDKVTRMTFAGDVPRPTPSEYEESGIYDGESELRREVDSVTLAPGEETILFSQSLPFSSAGDGISCTESTERGEFEAILHTQVQDGRVVARYAAEYTGRDMGNCEISISEK